MNMYIFIHVYIYIQQEMYQKDNILHFIIFFSLQHIFLDIISIKNKLFLCMLDNKLYIYQANIEKIFPSNKCFFIHINLKHIFLLCKYLTAKKSFAKSFIGICFLHITLRFSECARYFKNCYIYKTRIIFIVHIIIFIISKGA